MFQMIRFPFKCSSFLKNPSWNFKWNNDLKSHFHGTCLKFQHEKNDDNLENDLEISQEFYVDDVFSNVHSSNFSIKDVLVVMPHQMLGQFAKTQKRAELLLEETKTLARTISYWNVNSSEILPTKNLFSKSILGKKNFELLKEHIENLNADVVLFATDYLKPLQLLTLKESLNVEVYDRYTTVLKIFKENVATKEAKLQLALAELDYIKQNLHHLKDCDFTNFSVAEKFGGSFETFYEAKKQLIKERESKIKKSLEKIDTSFEIKRKKRIKMEIPSIAIVGYTNSGKTSLIKSLTQDSTLKPENRLFATLDVRVYEMNMDLTRSKALLIDTIGFISDIPTNLIHCFKSTLSEICTADLIVHVVDASHPDNIAQIETVERTLKEINVPEKLLNTMIEVSNKIDKVNNETNLLGIPISASERIGLDVLKTEMEKKLIQNTNRFLMKLKLPNGGQEYQWLYRESAVMFCEPNEEDPNFLDMSVVMTKSQLGRFVKLFNNKYFV